MKLNTFSAHLVPLLSIPMSETTEVQRALKEQTPYFDPDSIDPDQPISAKLRSKADRSGVGFDPELFKGKAGPGGGTDVDPFRAAFFTLAVALNGPRKESASSTWTTWHLPQEGSVLSGWGDFEPKFAVCPVTHQHLFGEALKQLVSNKALADEVRETRVSSNRKAEIEFKDGRVSRFEKPNRHDDPNLYRLAVIKGDVWRAVAVLIKQEF